MPTPMHMLTRPPIPQGKHLTGQNQETIHELSLIFPGNYHSRTLESNKLYEPRTEDNSVFHSGTPSGKIHFFNPKGFSSSLNIALQFKERVDKEFGELVIIRP